jgi:type I restriction enzyme S subunit
VNSLPVRQEWSTIPLRYVCQLNPYVDFSGFQEDDQLTFLPMDRVKSGYFISNSDKFSKYASSYNAFEEGDIVLAKVTPCFENGNIAVVEKLESGKGFGSSELFVVRPEKVNRRFLFYYLQSSAFKQAGEASMTGAGGLKRVSPDLLRKHHLPYPDDDTQRLIADYLDRETARIDALVAEKEKMLALLEEKRGVLINRAVTRGLDPAAPLKPSGIVWLEAIPKHWVIVRLKFFALIGYGLSQPPEYKVIGSPFVRATNVKQGNLSTDGLVYVDESDLPPERTVRLSAGDLIVVRSGAYTGDSALVTREWEGSILGYDMIVRLYRFCYPEFVSFSFLSHYILKDQINPLRLRAAQPHLNAEELGNLFFALPPLDEQQTICHHLMEESSQIKNAENLLQHSINLLKERRSALITAAVTGQIPVEEMHP